MMMTTTGAGPRTDNRGFTLLEMMVALGILSIVLLMTFSALTTTTNVSAMESARNELDRSGVRTLERMMAEFKSASVVSVSADGTVITYQVPADLDGNGSILDNAGSIEFGVNDNGAAQAGTISLTFRQNTVGGAPDVLSESALGRDLNNDGDTTDVYDRGRIERTTTVPGAVTSTISGRWLVQRSGNWGGDVDGDAMGDPVFTLNGKLLTMDVVMMGVDKAGNNQMVRCRTSVHLRN